VEPLAIPDLGDERIGLIGTGSGFQVLFAIWRTENIVQLAYASPLLEDQAHAAAFLNLISILAERVRSG
jgi:hypothetical protein